MAIINFPVMYIPDPTRGRPLYNGQILVGEPDLDPAVPANQKQLRVMQEDGTLVNVTQPFFLSAGGVPVYSGSYVRLDVDGNFSLKILDNTGAQVYYIENAYEGQPILVEDLPQYVAAEFADVANMKAGTALNFANTVDFNDYLGREVTTVVNNSTSGKGGWKYKIRNTDPGNLSTLVGGVWVGANHDLGGGLYAELVFSGVANVDAFGAVLDNATVGTAALQSASDYLGSVGGGEWYVPPTPIGSAYLTNEDITFGQRTTTIMDGWIKRDSTAVRTFDCVMLPAPGAENVRFERVMLDCNNVSSISGGILRRNNRFCTVGTAHVKNAATDATDGGGRGWIIEDGVTGNLPKMCAIDTLIVEDSFNGLGYNGGEGSISGDKNNSTNLVDKLILNNVECPIALFGNNPTYPHRGEDFSLVINSVIAKNCGHITSASAPAVTGIIHSIRASNVKINSFYLYNDATYKAAATALRLWDGEYKNCHVNAVIDSDLQIIVRDGITAMAVNVVGDTTSGNAAVTATDTSRLEVGYSVSGSGIPASTTIISIDSDTQFTMSNNATATASGVAIAASGTAVCKDSTFNVQVNGVVSFDMLTSSTSVANHIVNNNFDFKVDKVTSNKFVSTAMQNQISNFLRVQSKEHDCLVFGKIGTGNIINGLNISSFAGYTGQIGTVVLSDANGQAHSLNATTTGSLTIDGLSVLTADSFTVAGVPSAAANPRRIIFVSDESGGATLAFSNGSSWRRVQDLAVIS